MTQPPKGVFVDEEVGAQVISLINEAEKCLVMVTPYLQLERWGHAKKAIWLAAQRAVRITFLVRASDTWVVRRDVEWLSAQKVEVWQVEALHAKIYMNEKSVLVSSMNLYGSSASNSLEIALRVRSHDDAQAVRSYVKNRLMKSATRVGHPDQQSGVRALATPGAEKGHCIRCGSSIRLDPVKPLCEMCYSEWASYGNEAYIERYCHVCSRSSDTSYAKPLCQSCYFGVT